VVCDNCKRSGHIKKNCWARGGGSEGKAPRWYNAPKGLEPNAKSVTAASIKEEQENFAAAATIYDFSDYDFGGTIELSCLPTPPDPPAPRLGIQESFALLSKEISFLDVYSCTKRGSDGCRGLFGDVYYRRSWHSRANRENG
ncbi:hypothetical protein FB446DRAFT_709997, partial [Lentinula raphanica]